MSISGTIHPHGLYSFRCMAMNHRRYIAFTVQPHRFYSKRCQPLGEYFGIGFRNIENRGILRFLEGVPVVYSVYPHVSLQSPFEQWYVIV